MGLEEVIRDTQKKMYEKAEKGILLGDKFYADAVGEIGSSPEDAGILDMALFSFATRVILGKARKGNISSISKVVDETAKAIIEWTDFAISAELQHTTMLEFISKRKETVSPMEHESAGRGSMGVNHSERR